MCWWTLTTQYCVTQRSSYKVQPRSRIDRGLCHRTNEYTSNTQFCDSLCIGAYGPWAVDTLKVPPQTVYNALENCQTTKSMNFLTLNKYNIHILWKRKLISNDFVRYACLTGKPYLWLSVLTLSELKNNWLRVQTRCGTWWLDHHLVQTEEVQVRPFVNPFGIHSVVGLFWWSLEKGRRPWKILRGILGMANLQALCFIT